MCTFGFAAVYSAIIAFSTALPWASVLLHIVMVTSPAGGGQSFGVAAMSGPLADAAADPGGVAVEGPDDGAVVPPAHAEPTSTSAKNVTTNDFCMTPPPRRGTGRGISRRHIVRQRQTATTNEVIAGHERTRPASDRVSGHATSRPERPCRVRKRRRGNGPGGAKGSPHPLCCSRISAKELHRRRRDRPTKA